MTARVTSRHATTLAMRQQLSITSITSRQPTGAVNSLLLAPGRAAVGFTARGVTSRSISSSSLYAAHASVLTQHPTPSTTRFYTNNATTQSQPQPPSVWTAPSDPYSRPVVVVGVGNMGRRLATMWASTSRPVILYDHSRAALDSAISYIEDTLGHVCSLNGSHPGVVTTTTDMSEACSGSNSCSRGSSTNPPWMVIEALPELLPLKTQIMGQLDKMVPDDCILATNSSSFRSREMSADVKHKERLCNTHYYIPPRNIYVELMSSGFTDHLLLPFLADQMRGVGLRPIIVPRESQGLMFNRIWAATKRETLKVLAEGVGKPKDIDALFRDFFHAEKGPCERMDEVGLDTVRRIEEHYLDLAGVEEQGRKHLNWLDREFVARGELGEKSADGEGLFTAAERKDLKERRKREKRKVVEEYKGA